MLQQILTKLQQGGKMQMYMLAMGGYFLFNQLTGAGKAASSGAGSSPGMDAEDEMATSTDVSMSRMFKKNEGQWVSSMQSGTKSDSMLLMLHRTSSSAEVEFSSFFPTLASANARLVAPDRPCHGFSTCPAAGEPQDSKWLSSLIRSEGNPDKLAIIAVGRDAIAQALALAQKKKEVGLVVMMKPKVVAPKPSSMTATGEVSLQEAAATAIWRAAGAEHHETREPTFQKLSQSCQITLVYEAGDEEDEDLMTTLDNQGVEVKTRSATEDEPLAVILADEVRKGLDDAADDTL